jgi:Phospholipase_D-nuclease N-terminal
VLSLAPFIFGLALLSYCLIDALQTPDTEVRNLPKVVWILLILFIPVIGGIGWLVAGRPALGWARQVAWPSTRTAGFPEYERPSVRGPEDDPSFLREMKRGNDEHELLLNRWEADLRRREQQLRLSTDPTPGKRRDDGPDGSPETSAR